MASFFLRILLIIFCLVLQTTVLSPLNFGGIRIDFLLLLVIFSGLYEGKRKGSLTGFFSGILEDALSGGIMGMATLTKTLTGSLSGFLESKLYHKDFPIQLLTFLFLIIIHELLYLLLAFFREITSTPSTILKVTVLTVIINTLLAPPFCWSVKKILALGKPRHKRVKQTLDFRL